MEIVFETLVFDQEAREFVHPDGGRQQVYSNLVCYPDRVAWNHHVIDPDLKQRALEHCLGISLGPRPAKVLDLPGEEELDCTRSGLAFQRSNENTSF